MGKLKLLGVDYYGWPDEPINSVTITVVSSFDVPLNLVRVEGDPRDERRGICFFAPKEGSK